jgi:hypothetical protein
LLSWFLHSRIQIQIDVERGNGSPGISKGFNYGIYIIYIVPMPMLMIATIWLIKLVLALLCWNILSPRHREGRDRTEQRNTDIPRVR